ncbi:MAG: hypothetical protein DRJ05_06165 [Bacteroidetes bacterium]|nr:MAG: hypothetical protein DRJ05_06165 [Bacteroidota bacterium]
MFFHRKPRLFKMLLWPIGLILIIVAINYITSPIYKFKEGIPFSGATIYNPYAGMEGKNWRKANFQIQSYAWKGITSGRGNSNGEIYSRYKSLGYDIIATSDYQKINRYKENEPWYIPVYEHGYGIRKHHQVLIGSNKVLWKDFPIFQTLSNKQHILNLLREENELVIIAHPKLRDAYSPDNMKYLGNYDGIEVLNNYCTSFEYWDAALSTGHYVTIIGNDDAHDIYNPNEIGRNCTFINASSTDRKDILNALKSGNSFGASLSWSHGEPFDPKIERSKKIPRIKNIDLLKGDTISISTSTKAREFRFIGQNGKLLKKTKETKSASYVFKPGDTYVRTEIEFKDNTVFYLNAFCRMNGESPKRTFSPEIDIYRTWLLRVLGFASLLFIAFNFYHFSLKPRNKKGNN